MIDKSIGWVIAAWACCVVTIVLVAFQGQQWTATAWTIAVIQAIFGLAGLACMAKAIRIAWLGRAQS